MDSDVPLGYVKREDKYKVDGLVKTHTEVFAEVDVGLLLQSIEVSRAHMFIPKVPGCKHQGTPQHQHVTLSHTLIVP